MSDIVIVGTGLAGYSTARELRKLDKAARLTLISADGGESYYKPKLSAAFTDGKTPTDLPLADATKMAAQLNATILTHTRITAIHTDSHRLVHSAGEIAYGRLVMAVGADPIRIPLQGDAVDAVLSVNDLDDYTRFRAALDGKRNVTLMGAGLIGCEFACDLRRGGFEVSVYDPSPAPLGSLLPPQAATALHDALQAAGVDWHLGTTVKAVDYVDTRLRITDSAGYQYNTDIVLSAIGLRPRIALAKDSGIDVARGIVTNRRLASSAADVYAIGDCAEVAGLSLPFVLPITHGARVLSNNLAGGDAQLSYPAMPVVVKTSYHPVVVAPPPRGIEGEWIEAYLEGGIRALFHDVDGALRGFALTGTAISEKAALTEQLPALLV